MKPKLRELLGRCIEDGLDYGYRRAFKHSDSPSEEHVKECILNDIWVELDEWFDFEESHCNG